MNEAETPVPLGRKPRSIPRVQRHFRIREDISATVDLLLLDPMREKIKYGRWSDLIETLLVRWVHEQRGGKGTASALGIADRFKTQTALNILEQQSAEDPRQAIQQAVRLLKEAIA